VQIGKARVTIHQDQLGSLKKLYLWNKKYVFFKTTVINQVSSVKESKSPSWPLQKTGLEPSGKCQGKAGAKGSRRWRQVGGQRVAISRRWDPKPIRNQEPQQAGATESDLHWGMFRRQRMRQQTTLAKQNFDRWNRVTRLYVVKN